MNKLYIIKSLLVCSIFLCMFAMAQGQNDSLATENAKHSTKKTYMSAAVVPFYDTLFYVNAGVGLFTPQERAAAITERIRNVSKEHDRFHSDSLTILTEENSVEIVYHDVIIMTITATDSKLKGKSQLTLAQDYKKIIEDAIAQHQKNTRLETILWRIFLILLIVAVQYFLIKITNRLFRKIAKKIEQLKGEKIKTFKIKSYKLMGEEKITKFILFLLKMVKYLIIILMLYISISLVFSVFPSTRYFANTLFGYVLMPLKSIFSHIIGFIPNLITIVVTILIFRYLIKGLRFITEEIDKGRLTIKGFYSDWAYPTFNIIRILLYAFMFVVIFPLLPFSNTRVFQGVSVFIGIVFSLGSSSAIGNLVSGLVLTYMRPFKVGDRIKIGDLIGNVIEKTPFVTRIRTPKNEEVTIPNSGVMSAQTLNFSQSARNYGLILHTEVTFGYDTPWQKIHELLLNAAKQTPDVLEDPKPFILQTALNDFYAEYQLNVYVIDADKMPRIYSDLHQNIQEVFHKAGLELVASHYYAHRDGNRSTLPTTHLPNDYKAPSFHVKVER